MSHLPTAVINAAGRGTRMGQSRPKCLTPILGKPLIRWQLQALAPFTRITVAVGYCSQDVMDAVRAIRPDANFVTNADYSTTGTAASLSMAAATSPGPVLSIDGDLLVHPADLLALATPPFPAIGVCKAQSLVPVYVKLKPADDNVLYAYSFHHSEEGLPPIDDLEWTGLICFDPRTQAVSGSGHVYQMITPLLPCRAIPVRCREIDFPSEIAAMEMWLNRLIDERAFDG